MDEKDIKSLGDAGCSARTIREYRKCCECGNLAGQIRELDRQRQEILDAVHRGEEQIATLDYLMYSLEKERDKK